MTYVAARRQPLRYHQHTMDSVAGSRLSAGRRRRILQIIFVFVNVALVEAHLPGPLWIVIGGLFWVALIGIALAGSPLVCGTMCWVGAIQDFAEPLARARVRLDPRWGRGLVLGALVLWMPLGWLLWPSVAAHDRTPFDVAPGSWQNHLFGVAFAAVVALSVMLLGKRGICKYLCPFNEIVAVVRRAILPGRRVVTAEIPGCASQRQSCTSCAHAVAPARQTPTKGHTP